jgi:hypothetical protein
VRRRGRARWRTRSGLPLTTEGNVGAATVGNVKVDDECPPPLVLRTVPKYGDVGRGEGDNKAGVSGLTAAAANACAVNAAACAATSWRQLSSAKASADACAANASACVAASWPRRLLAAFADFDSCAANVIAANVLRRRSLAAFADSDSFASNAVATASVNVIALAESNGEMKADSILA